MAYRMCRRKSCRRKVKSNALCKKHFRESANFGNPNFIGNGIAKCYACGQPVIAHSILEFCPFLDVMDMHSYRA